MPQSTRDVSFEAASLRVASLVTHSPTQASVNSDTHEATKRDLSPLGIASLQIGVSRARWIAASRENFENIRENSALRFHLLGSDRVFSQ